MSGLAIDATAGDYVRVLEDRERHASQVSLPIARRAVARKTGVATGTLENLRRGRIKGVRAWVVAALRNALIRELEAEIARDEHELTVLRAAHREDRDEQMAEILSSIQTKRQALNGGP